MNDIRIVNIRSSKPYSVYCGRKNKSHGVSESKWANPFIIGKHGDRAEVILKHRLWINSQPDLLAALPELKGLTLGCWCNFPTEDCHCRTLIELSESKHIRNWFSNMLPLDAPFIYQGIEFKTVENFYQAMKLRKDDLSSRWKIAQLPPYESKSKIKQYKLADGWQDRKLAVMEYGLRKKFARGTSWFDKLMLTTDPQGCYYDIVEYNGWHDVFWGVDLKTRDGENNLGKLLMKIREENK